jgi:hypothetical protein
VVAPATVVAPPLLSFFELPHAPATNEPTTKTTVAHRHLAPLGRPLFMPLELIVDFPPTSFV